MNLKGEPDFPIEEYLKDLIAKLGHVDISEKLAAAREVRNSRKLRIGRLYRKAYDAILMSDNEWDLIDPSNEVSKPEFISDKSFELVCEGKLVISAVEVFIEINDHPELTVPTVFVKIERGINDSYHRVICFESAFVALGLFECGRIIQTLYDGLMLSLKYSSYHLVRGEEDDVHYF